MEIGKLPEITFANFDPQRMQSEDLLEIGGGVLGEMARAFGFELSGRPTVAQLGAAIEASGRRKTLQDNIAEVRQRLGVDGDAGSIARNWVERTGILVPVNRSYMDPKVHVSKRIPPDVAVMTGGVRNWMERRAGVLEEAVSGGLIRNTGRLVLAGGTRKMKTPEGPGVEPGMPEAVYLRNVVKPRLEASTGREVDVVEAQTDVGDGVAAALARSLRANELRVLVGTNAGAWPQNGGQIRRGLLGMGSSYYDLYGSGPFVMTDEVQLGTGAEEKAAPNTQNPLTALGIVTRGAYELLQNMEA